MPLIPIRRMDSTEQIKVPVNGKNLFLYDIEVNGVLRQLALLKKEGSLGTFVNPRKS